MSICPLYAEAKDIGVHYVCLKWELDKVCCILDPRSILNFCLNTALTFKRSVGWYENMKCCMHLTGLIKNIGIRMYVWKRPFSMKYLKRKWVGLESPNLVDIIRKHLYHFEQTLKRKIYNLIKAEILPEIIEWGPLCITDLF
jgi:hypothetical protein